MPRYFLEVSYKGTNYSGFQVQKNAKTIQSSVQEALQTLYQHSFLLTGSSRTDAGVHAIQNFFHFDTPMQLHQHEIYNLNAILPADIAAKAFYNVKDDSHSRFGAISREYKYFIYTKKDPFLKETAWFYPYSIDFDLLKYSAQLINNQQNFISFSKKKTQVNNFICSIEYSQWINESGCLVYNIQANRFLRGMVRGLVSTMLKLARGTLTLPRFHQLLSTETQATADFSAPPQGLFLTQVSYPPGYLTLVD